MRIVKGSILAILASTSLAFGDNCPPKAVWETPESHAFSCSIYAKVPFDVRETSFGKRWVVFFAKERIQRKTRYKSGMAFQTNGQPFSNRSAAEQSLAAYVRRKSCTVEQSSFSANVHFTFTVACPL